MWMTPFYLFLGLFFVYNLKSSINLNSLKKFMIWFFIYFYSFTSNSILYVSLSKDNKRTDYPGKEIAQLVQSQMEQKFYK